MKRLSLTLLVALLGGSLFFLGRASAQDEMEAEAAGEGLPEPGAEQAELAKLEGKWSVAAKFLMGPDQWTEFPAEANFRSVLRGFFVEQTFRGEMMGTQYEGRGFLGYDPRTKEYISVWLDCWNPHLFLSRGTKSEGATTYLGEEPNRYAPGLTPFKQIYRHEGEDKFLFEMWMTMPDGNLTQVGLLTYTRDK